MKTSIILCLLATVLLFPAFGHASSQFGEGEIDQDLRFEGFDIKQDGFLTGFIVNTSNKTRPAVKVDAWTTNLQETRIFWRKSLSLGDIPPGGRVTIREPYQLDDQNVARIKFMFRLPGKDNFRN
jgi:hypothetical protein